MLSACKQRKLSGRERKGGEPAADCSEPHRPRDAAPSTAGRWKRGDEVMKPVSGTVGPVGEMRATQGPVVTMVGRAGIRVGTQEGRLTAPSA